MNGAVGGDLVSHGRLSVAALAEPSLSAASSYAGRPAAEIAGGLDCAQGGPSTSRPFGALRSG